MIQFRANFIFLIWIFLLQSFFILLVLDLPGPHSVTGFVTIPAELAFAIITAAVKLKLILVKILFALRTIGILQNRPRHKRSPKSLEDSNDFSIRRKRSALIGHNHNDILSAWSELESVAEQPLQFDKEYCNAGVKAPYSIAYPGSRSRKRREADDYAHPVQYDESVEYLEDADASPSGTSPAGNSSEDLLLYFDSAEDSRENMPDSDSEDDSYVGESRMPTSEISESKEDHLNNVSYSQFISSVIGSMMQDNDSCEVLQEGLSSLEDDEQFDGDQGQGLRNQRSSNSKPAAEV